MFRHILVPTDGSPASNRAFATALNLAKASGGRITVMHVIPNLATADYLDAFVPYPGIYSPEAMGREAERQSKALLEKIAAKAEAAGVTCATVTDRTGRPWRAIVRNAQSRKCDLIAMASHGRRGLEAVLLGSETTKVLTHSKTPVLVVK